MPAHNFIDALTMVWDAFAENAYFAIAGSRFFGWMKPVNFFDVVRRYQIQDTVIYNVKAW
ncbi:hypothetical protein BCR43DRAFT_485074 [Syncephalastrum racemosum]|uniref:Uncharacterized protein n=1 Tax=Syncephalastrum racemosum TaxID=13706 RepID=A0A1X2HLX7_SYNRA|nr:hypothetical protein BCR43DRAFT_485074 [Syncephalastrum racemosum]